MDYCCRADKNPYRHDGRVDKDSYRHNRCADSHCANNWYFERQPDLVDNFTFCLCTVVPLEVVLLR